MNTTTSYSQSLRAEVAPFLAASRAARAEATALIGTGGIDAARAYFKANRKSAAAVHGLCDALRDCGFTTEASQLTRWMTDL